MGNTPVNGIKIGRKKKIEEIEKENEPIEYLDSELEESVEELEEEEEEEEEEPIEEKKKKKDANIKLYIYSSVVYIQEEYVKLFGKPPSGGKISVGIIKNINGTEDKIIIQDYDFGNDVELLKRATQANKKFNPFLILLVVIIVGIIYFFFFKGNKEQEALIIQQQQQEPQVIQTPIPPEYIEAYQEKMSGSGEYFNLMQETKILANEVNQYKDQLQNCNIELDKLNYRANYGTITTSTSCDNTKSEELVRQLQECEEKNKENEYLIYSGKIFDKLCKNSRDNTYCAQIYYDYLQINR